MKAWRRYAPVSVVLLYLTSLLLIYSEVGHQDRGTSSRRGRRSGSESDMQAMYIEYNASNVWMGDGRKTKRREKRCTHS